MGVGSALNTALSGMNAFATQIGYVSENLANTSTVGYKGIQSNFQSYVTESTPTYESPGGVTVTPIYQNTVAGQVTSTSVGTNFAIVDGNGFAPVTSPTVTNGVTNFSNSPQMYTQACDFTINNNGYLVNSAGDYLMGVQEETSYSNNIPGTPSLGNLTGVRVTPAVYQQIPAQPSTTIDYNANFPANATTNASGAVTATSQVQFYDSLGTAQTLNIVYTQTAATATTPSSWTIQPGDVTIPSDKNATVTLPAAPAATLTFTASGAISGPTDANGNSTIALTITGLSDGAANMTTAPGTAATPTTIPQLVLKYGTPAVAATATTPAVVASGSTQYSGTSLDVRSVDDLTGQAPGSFQSADVNSNGDVVFNYSNGEQLTPYRIPLVTFSNPDELQRVTGATFAANNTLAGSPSIQWAGEGDSGTITPSSIEASNVDIATELTQMIVAQRAYTSNSKVITAADEMIQDALGLIR
jgi:flagellar hook protein FlgE